MHLDKIPKNFFETLASMETVNESDREMSDSEDEEEKGEEKEGDKKKGGMEEEEEVGKKKNWDDLDDYIW